jgi:hypothetical protein
MSIPATELEPEDPDEPKAAPKTTPIEKAAAKPMVKPTMKPMVVSSIGPDELPYDEGRPVPQGYEPDTRMRKGLIIAGAITLMVPYLSSAAVALRARRDAEEGLISEEEGNAMQALWVPIAGPFIAIGESERNSAREIAPFIAAGVVQTAGAGMLLAGILAREKVLVKKQAVVAAPIVSAGTVGVGVSGSF